MDRVFLDANVLFSTAWRPDSGLLRLWRLGNVELVTSSYAAQEAEWNLPAGEHQSRLKRLLRSVRIVPEALSRPLPQGITLPPKDHPILQAALGAQASHLLTGDKDHFGAYFGRRVGATLILPPGDYLRSRGKRT